MNKKIVILVLHLGTGGAERVVCNLANILVQNNDVKIISTYKLNDTPAFNLSNKIELEYLLENLKPNKQELKYALKKFNILLICKELFKSLRILWLRKSLMIKAIKKLDCDIVISTRILHTNWLGKYANSNIIKIAQEHNHHNNNPKYIKKVIKSLKNIDYFMPVSKELCDFYSSRLDKTKVKYIPNFIEKMPLQKSLLQNKQLVSVGRLEKVKGFDDLIDIFYIFQKNHPDWVLHIVGDGSEKQNLQNKINKLDLNHKVILCGNKLSTELEKEYLNSSLFLMTSFSESFGLVLVEAASFGLPLIAFDSAQGAKEIIEDNKNGFLIPGRDKQKFASKISELINDYDKMQSLSLNASNTANRFSQEVVCKEWNNFIENISKEKNIE